MTWIDRVSPKTDLPSGIAAPSGTVGNAAQPETEHAEHTYSFKKVAAVALLASVAVGGLVNAKSKNPIDVSGAALRSAEYIAKGFHAIPKPDANPFKEMPSMHRLMNVVGMAGGFATVQYLSNIVFACKINGSNCKEITRDEVPPPLRFLHGIVQYNPFSDAPRDQWLKVLHQTLPAVGGAFGAVKGSHVFFHDFNKRGRDYEKWMKQATLNPIEADSAARYAQGEAYGKLAGIFAAFSAASGLGWAYGIMLNEAFKKRNGGQIAWNRFLRKFTGNTSTIGFASEKGMGEVLKGIERHMRDGDAQGFAEQFVKSSISQLVSLTPEREAEIIKHFKEQFEGNALQVVDKKEIPALAELMRKQALQIIAATEKELLNLGGEGTDIMAKGIRRFPGVKAKLDDILKRTQQPPLLPLPPSRSRS